MKKFISLLFIVFIWVGCKQKTESEIINTAAVDIAGVFISENINSSPTFRIKGKTSTIKEEGNIFHITGSVEGFSAMNYPVSMEHFKETLHFLGGAVNEKKNWECIEIYVGNKKMR